MNVKMRMESWRRSFEWGLEKEDSNNHEYSLNYSFYVVWNVSRELFIEAPV